MTAESSMTEHKRRVPGRPFPKGKSGNPGGRSKRVADLEDALQAAHGAPEVLAVVAKLHKVALAGDVQAARVYLDRILGPVRIDDERIERRAREIAETIAAGRRKHNLTLEQLEFMGANAGQLPPGVRLEDLGDWAP